MAHNTPKYPVAKCEFCFSRNAISEMKKVTHTSYRSSDQRFQYFCSECCSVMYQYEEGDNHFLGDSLEAHRMYLETMKKCYPKMYKSKYGTTESSA